MGNLVLGIVFIMISISIFIWGFKERNSHIDSWDKAEYIKIMLAAFFMIVTGIILLIKGLNTV